jgi:Tfp pilus assembly protein PilF
MSADEVARRYGAEAADAPDAWSDRRGQLAAAIGILALAAWAYAPVVGAGWIWDDDLYVTNNTFVQGSWNGLRDIWLGFHRDPRKGGALVVKTYQYYPLVFSSFWLDHKLFGLEPLGYHVVNVLLHLVNALLVFRLARRLEVPGAAFVAGLFALHPMMVESVAWVSERKNLLSGLFYLSAFLAYLRFDDTRTPRWYAASFVLFVAAMLAKTVTATLPSVLLLAVLWRRRRVGLRDLAFVLPFVAAGTVLGAFAVHLEKYAVGAYRAEFQQTAFERWLLIAPRAFGFYAVKTVWPHPITFVYPRFDPAASGPVGFAWLVACVAAVAALFAARRRIGPGPLLLLLASACTLAPALGFVPVFPHRYSWVADHFAYLGLLGFFALIASAGAWWLRRVAGFPARPRLAVGIAATLLAVCAARSHEAAKSYRDEETLWTDTLAESPDAWIAMINLGAEYMTRPPHTEERMARAMELFRQAENYELGRIQALTNQGVWYRRHGDDAAAVEVYRRALALDPKRARTRQYLANVRVDQVRRALAEQRSGDARELCLAAMPEVGSDPRLAPLCGRVLAPPR